jgi:acyl-CoA synthetase (AMP-forming)/AMP-acid ligase II
MTEIFNPITVLEPVETDACFRMLGEGAVGMVGWPAAGVEISVRDEKGRALPAGAEGEIFVHAEHMYEGYLRDTDTFEPAPRFHATGDLGRFDPVHGLRLLGRLHDVIKTGGYKVHPQEVETALRERGASGDLVVLGLPSERWGEVVVLARAQPEGGSFADLQTCAAALTAYKRPRIFVAVPAIRRNAIGKVDRRAIRDDILNRYELVDGPHPELRSCNA